MFESQLQQIINNQQTMLSLLASIIANQTAMRAWQARASQALGFIYQREGKIMDAFAPIEEKETAMAAAVVEIKGAVESVEAFIDHVAENNASVVANLKDQLAAALAANAPIDPARLQAVVNQMVADTELLRAKKSEIAAKILANTPADPNAPPA